MSPRSSIAAHAAVSIPFRRKTEISKPVPGASQPKDLLHLLAGQFEVEDIDVFRKPFDPRGARYSNDVLLHQPAQANLGRGLAVFPADLAQQRIALDTALGNRT